MTRQSTGYPVCSQARGRVDTLFRELWANDDADNYRAAMGVLDGRYTWLEEGVADPSRARAAATISSTHVSSGIAVESMTR